MKQPSRTALRPSETQPRPTPGPRRPRPQLRSPRRRRRAPAPAPVRRRVRAPASASPARLKRPLSFLPCAARGSLRCLVGQRRAAWAARDAWHLAAGQQPREGLRAKAGRGAVPPVPQPSGFWPSRTTLGSSPGSATARGPRLGSPTFTDH